MSRKLLASAGLVCVFLGIFLGYPLFWILGAPTIESGHLDLSFVLDVFSQRRYLRAFENSLYASAGAMAASVVVGVPIAVLVARTDMPCRNAIRGLAAASFITPSFLLGFAYIMLLGPNNGLLNQGLQYLFGFETGPIDIYSLGGFVFLATLECVPLVVITVSGRCRRWTEIWKTQRRILGASPLKVLAKITLPLVWPAISAGALLAFISTISLYGAPRFSACGRPDRNPIRAGSRGQAIGAGWLVALAHAYFIIRIFVYQRLLGRQTSFVTVTGKWAPAELMRLGKWRFVALACAFLHSHCAIFAMPS